MIKHLLMAMTMLAPQAHATSSTEASCSVTSPVSMLAYLDSKYDGSSPAEPYAVRARELLAKTVNRSAGCGCQSFLSRSTELYSQSKSMSDKDLLNLVRVELPRLRQEASSCQFR